MADRFWVGDTGNWSDNTNHWSASSGGAPNASKPTSSDNVIFDASSFTIGSQSVVMDENGICLDKTWTGATNTPTLNVGANNVTYHGDVVLIAAMVLTGTTGSINFIGSGSKTITTNGLTIACRFVLNATGTLTLQDNVTISNDSAIAFQLNSGTFVTGGLAITLSAGQFSMTGTSPVLTPSSSTITCVGFEITSIGSPVITANTSTIKVTGTGQFDGNGLTTYNIVELNGTTHTISGSNTFATLTFKADTTQTITFTDGTTQTVTTATITGSSGKVKTLVGTSTAGWTITKAGGGTVNADFLALSYSTATPGQTWFTANSTDTVGNSGWIFAWTGKVMGTTDPAKINGIAIGTILKVNGVVTG